jgi:hypothetical protein
MADARDRDDQPLEKGDRVRIVKHVGWRELAGRRRRLLGEYGYVKELGLTLASVQLEEHPEIRTNLQPHQIALAPGTVEPEIEEPRAAQSSADVQLFERVPAYGKAQYTTWRIGEDEGTATILHESGRWELTFADFPGERDGGEVGPYDDSALGAWNVWNRARSLLGDR